MVATYIKEFKSPKLNIKLYAQIVSRIPYKHFFVLCKVASKI